ncbi:hypothetical protein HanIR_Chr06g0271161 [Helianthus annuus]|nr:hypothetical protein HanIR_Chr06g0271161 [Helianthus annuus]
MSILFKHNAPSRSSFKILNYPHDCFHMLLLWLMHKLTDNSNRIGNIWPTMSQVNQFSYQSLVSFFICWLSSFIYFKIMVDYHRSVNGFAIYHSSLN